jgi:hypothetical protein
MHNEKQVDHDEMTRKVDLPDLSADGRRPLTPLQDSGMTKEVVMVQPRSTYDPLQINFASVSIAEKLQSKHAGRKQRIWGWLILVTPTSLLALYGTVQIWSTSSTQARVYPGPSVGDYLMLLLMTGLIWLPAAFWIFVMCRKRTG